MKILSIMGVDLYPFIRSLDVDVEDNVIYKALEKRYQSFHAVISNASYSPQTKQEVPVKCYPLLRDANDGQVLSGIHNLASHLKINTKMLNLVDMYLYQMTHRINGRKFISAHDEIVGHTLSFFFNNDEFDQFKPNKVDFTKAISYSETKDFVYFTTSTFALARILPLRQHFGI